MQGVLHYAIAHLQASQPAAQRAGPDPPLGVFCQAENQIGLDQRTAKGLHERHSAQRYRGHGAGVKIACATSWKKASRVAGLPRKDRRDKRHPCGLAVLEATQPQRTAHPQRPVSGHEQRWHGIGW